MVSTRPLQERLYLANATVLLTHQMDAAYWQEWRLFGLPGGIQLYLLLNLPIVLLVLRGARAVALGSPSGRAFCWGLVGCGLFAAGFHAVYLLAGDEAFRLPVCLGLLAATGMLSVAQALSLMRLPRA